MRVAGEFPAHTSGESAATTGITDHCLAAMVGSVQVATAVARRILMLADRLPLSTYGLLPR